MRFFVIVLMSMTLALASCSTATNSSPNADNATGSAIDDLNAEASKPAGGDAAPPDNAANSQAPAPETSEADLAQDQQSLENPPAEQPADVNPPPEVTEATPAPEQPAEQPPAEQPSAEQTAQETAPQEPSAEAAAKITALNFDANTNGGTVLLKTSAPVQYTTRTNADTNQFVIELQNTTVPKKFQRPYITKEFNSNIASINAYQAKGPFKVARIVVQLREPSEPQVAQDGNLISLSSGGGAPAEGAGQEMAQQTEPEAPPAEGEEPAVSEEAEQAADPRALNAKGLDDFLLGNTKFYGRRISLEVKDADIRDVFRFISEESGLNIISSEEVAGKVSLKLKKIPWDQALTVLLQSRQLGYVKQGNILRIAPLKTLRAETDAAREVIESQKQLKPMRVQIFPVSYAKAEDLELQAKEFLTTRGKVKADKRTNSLVVTDIDDSIQKIRRLITRLDTQTPQVLIEAKIVEARESFERAIGVSWSMSGADKTISTNASNGAPITAHPGLNFASGSGSAGSAGGLDMGLQIGTFDVIGDLKASLQLLENERLVKILSSPRIMTLDRVEANIEQTTQFPIINSSNDASGKPQSSVTFQNVKLQLQVKPQITAAGGIIMDVTVLREFPGAITKTASGAQAREVNSRKAATQVLIENGDTVVIGGIYQSDVTDGESGVPFLRKIPILGALFRSKNITREKNELVIFLTPRILNKEQAFVRSDEENGT